jgi:hypothetical protein
VRRWRVRRHGERPDLDYTGPVRKNGGHSTLREQNRERDVNEVARKEMYANLFRPIWRVVSCAALELIGAVDPQGHIWSCGEGKREMHRRKVEPPATRVSRDIWAQATIQLAPTLAGMYCAQGAPDTALDTAFGPARRRYLTLSGSSGFMQVPVPIPASAWP